MSETVLAADGKPRCAWCGDISEFFDYHDKEWGFPVSDDRRLFEKLCLESFQSGLSWRTILNKRENFRQAFFNFDIDKVASFDQNDIERLLNNAGIVRHRGKIEAVINNAKCVQKMIYDEGSFASYIWQHEPKTSDLPKPQSVSTSDISTALSKKLKKLGWKFVGPTTVYSFMQAMGLINDHVESCVIREKVEQARREFIRPKQ